MSEPATLKGWRHAFRALRNPNYRYFYGGQTLSLIGTWTRTAALGWVAIETTHSPFLLGLVFTLNALPLLLFATYAGALADRYPKMHIFTLTSWFSLLSSAGLALMLFHGPVPIGYLMAFGALWGLSTAFEMPARQTLMVELVGKPDLVNAIALNSAMVNSTRIVGPAVGGLLLASVGAAWCFLLDALSYLAVLYGLHRIQLPAEHYAPKAAPEGWGHLLEGFRYLRQARTIAIALAMMAVVGVAGWAYQSQMAAFAKIQLGQGPWTYSWLLCMNGLGACAAALLVAFQGARLVRVRTLYAGVALYGCAIILFGLARQAWLAGALLFFAGAGLILFFSVGNSLVQSQSPDHLRGRLMGLWALVFGGGMPLGSFWMGLLASRTSPGFALQVGGLGCLLGAAAVWAAFRRGAPKKKRRHPEG